MEHNQKSNVFPLFFTMQGRTILVVGAGKVAMRRVQSLCRTACNITVVSKDGFDAAFAAFAAEQEQLRLLKEPFAEPQLNGCDIVLAATNDRALNHAIYIECKQRGILVNVCDAPEECDFYFPALFETETLIGGLVSKEGNAHAAVKQAAQKIREAL